MQQRITKNIILASMALMLAVAGVAFSSSGQAHADTRYSVFDKVAKTKGYTPPTTATPCGGGSDAVAVSIDIGCRGQGNPIADAAFAIIRILSDGVGLIIIGSIVVGGIQYSASRGDPQATALAVGRIRSTLIALLIYIFGYAILNYIIPAGFLH